MVKSRDIIVGWRLVATLKTRTPLIWLERDGEFRRGANPPSEQLPPQHASWVPVTRNWQETGIDLTQPGPLTRASQFGQVPEDGGGLLPFLIQYRRIVENAAAAIVELEQKYPECTSLLKRHPRWRPRRKR